MNRQAIFPDRDTVKKLRAIYPKGCRVELLYMDDGQAPPKGTKGTVTGVDDAGSVMVDWDNGSRLQAAFGADVIARLSCLNGAHVAKALPQDKLAFVDEKIVSRTTLKVDGFRFNNETATVEHIFDMADPHDRKRLMDLMATAIEDVFDSPYDAMEFLEKEFKDVLDTHYLPFH